MLREPSVTTYLISVASTALLLTSCSTPEDRKAAMGGVRYVRQRFTSQHFLEKDLLILLSWLVLMGRFWKS